MRSSITTMPCLTKFRRQVFQSTYVPGVLLLSLLPSSSSPLTTFYQYTREYRRVRTWSLINRLYRASSKHWASCIVITSEWSMWTLKISYCRTDRKLLSAHSINRYRKFLKSLSYQKILLLSRWSFWSSSTFYGLKYASYIRSVIWHTTADWRSQSYHLAQFT
jgi:hypothetical protein